MGYYIETEEPKDVALIVKHHAKALTKPVYLSGDNTTICVIDNGPFMAAGIYYNEKEFRAFAQPDNRPRTWLSLPTEKVLQLCPYVKDVLHDPKA